MDSIKDILRISEEQIRSGAVEAAKLGLKPLLTRSLTVSEREKGAELFRRLGLHSMALRILRPVVIGRGRMLPTASVNARIEYGAALIQMDLVEEGRKFLELSEVKDRKEAKRWRALSFLHDFQLSKAADEIARVIQEYDSHSYDHLVLKVNWLVSLLGDLNQVEKRKLFQRLSEEVAQAIDLHQAERLRSAHRSLTAQAVFFSESKQVLKTTHTLPGDYLGFFEVFTSLFHEARAKRISAKVLNHRYHDLRQFAFQKNWFEGVREIDFHYARIFKPEQLPLIQMGTRHLHYQARYLHNASDSTRYCFSRTHPVSKTFILKRVHDLSTLPEAGKLRELFRLLFSEQYAPLTPHAIWSVLAPDEHYFEPHSTNRIHQWVRRLKHWLKKNEIPAVLTSSQQGYRLVADKPLRCEARLLFAGTSDQNLLLNLKKRFSEQKLFSIHEVSLLEPEVGLRELQYRLKNYVEAGELIRIGKARAVKYQVVDVESNNSTNKAARTPAR